MNKRSISITGLLLFFLCLLNSLPAAAQYKPEGPSSLANPVAIVLLTVIVGLFIAIAILGSAVLSAMDIYRERMKKEGGSKTALLTGGLILTTALLSSHSSWAQDAAEAAEAAAPAVSHTISGLAPFTFYLLVSVIVLELLIIICLLFTLRILVGLESRSTRKKKAAVPGKPSVSWLEKLNKTKSLDATSEAEADMGHDYDGIRELNNPTPPWWRWGFYCSMIFAAVYLWRYQVAHSAPTQLEELSMAEAEAAAAKEEYLKNAANNVDENSVTLLTAADDISSGQKLFAANCAACHGPQGQGVVGPNLTDSYWLHGGDIKKVFSTIKYGVPDKGMKSWKDDFSPKQLAQLASYIKSIHGSNPPNPKEPQGTEEKE
ncbi:cbb3-type cytochrome c oxidase N-terminal domain-containing protein [Chitinophaga tropicalis]|uniref:C-type cytochrome n=1 Tax=Chitinophaga tropicalis TaxID=2683588 RepID=A0A7K1TY82_9BACT|nr:cbb3-type cytochrome c oxidase N-terminal domain-containing protein [Chitinophaga tropicalis]MVT07074.1 c-type cytochrome [Chitinophaga tropicalis]